MVQSLENDCERKALFARWSRRKHDANHPPKSSLVEFHVRDIAGEKVSGLTRGRADTVGNSSCKRALCGIAT